MTKRGIEEPVANAVNGASAITTNGSAALLSGAPVTLDSPTTPMLVDAHSIAASAALHGQHLNAYAHLNGVIDQSVVAMMPDMKKIKVGHGDDAGGSGSPVTTALSGISTVVSGGTPVNADMKSRVVHLRNVPNDTTVNDLYQLAAPFGAITKHLMVKSKHQAFIEFADHLGAVQMTTYWAQTAICGVPNPMQPTIRGRHIHCQISNHKELNTKFENNNNGDTGSSYSMDRNGGSLSNGDSNNNNNHNKDTSSTPSPVIRVIVENLIYVVSLESLHTIFSRAGKVQKIVTFTKNSIYQALVQYADIPSAIQAKLSLDGQCMFQNGNVLRIEYSKLQNLIVKYNNEKSRDYTQQLSAGNYNANSGGGGGGTSSMNGNGSDSSVASAVAASDHFNSLLAAAAGGNSAAASALGNFGTFGSPTTNGQFAAAAAAAAARGGYPSSAASIQQALSLQSLVSPSMFAAQAAAGTGLSGLVLSPVIHVSGLSTEHTTPDALFTLFGVYGDVIRVKILFNKKDTALIQMAEPTQAHLAITNLDRTRLYGKTLRVNSSKHTVVQMPKEGHQHQYYSYPRNNANIYGSNSNITVLNPGVVSTPDSGLTKDYTNSALHRFKRPGSKNFNNIYPPSETLHVSNIPQNISEDDLRQAFLEETGKEVAKFKFFPNDRRMALVQFDCIENSILALIKMHNYKVAEHSHLRVSFSKSPV